MSFEEALGCFAGTTSPTASIGRCITREWKKCLDILATSGNATNKSIEYTNVILQGLGPQYFNFVAGGDNGFGLKPEPGMLLHIMERLTPMPDDGAGRRSTNDINGDTMPAFECVRWATEWVIGKDVRLSAGLVH